MNEPPHLRDVTVARRYRHALKEARKGDRDGEVLSYVIWPDEFPSLTELERIVRFRRRQSERKHSRVAT